jgi:hypothetical protein
MMVAFTFETNSNFLGHKFTAVRFAWGNGIIQASMLAALREAAIDAVDGSSTGT